GSGAVTVLRATVARRRLRTRVRGAVDAHADSHRDAGSRALRAFLGVALVFVVPRDAHALPDAVVVALVRSRRDGGFHRRDEGRREGRKQEHDRKVFHSFSFRALGPKRWRMIIWISFLFNSFDIIIHETSQSACALFG